MSVHDAQSMMSDFTTKLIISDLGNGNYRHQLIRFVTSYPDAMIAIFCDFRQFSAKKLPFF
jgi:hypothetical protein